MAQGASTTPFVLDIIENGYKLLLMSIPPSYSAPNNSSTCICGIAGENQPTGAMEIIDL